MKLGKRFYLTLTMLAALSSVFVACGRRGSDDLRVATKGNVTLEGMGVVSGSTVEGLPYYIKVHRIYSVRNGIATGYNNGYMGNCIPANGVYGSQVGAQGVYVDIQVNAICKTFPLAVSGSIVTDADLGIEVSMTCDNGYSCDMVYLNIVGRNPSIYSNNNFQGNVIPVAGGGLIYGGNNVAWTMQADTEIKQLGVMKSINQDKIMAAVELQTKYSQKLRPDVLMNTLNQTAQEFYGRQ